MKIYLAAPLFNDNERAFNASLTDIIEPHAEVFLPQRDGSLLIEMVSAGVALEVAELRVFEQDRQAISRADVLVAVLDGAHVDEGVAYELGFASALGCTCVGLQTDVRRALPTGNNPMIKGSLLHIFGTVDGLVAWLIDHAAIFEKNNNSTGRLRA